MPVPANTLRFSFVGKIGVSDIWNCSVWLRPVGSATAPTTGAATDALLTSLKGVSGWTTLRSAILTCIRSIDSLDHETLYSYATTGNQATAVAQQSDVAAGTGATQVNPPQVCQVMTLQTGVAGRSQRGRIYWPATALGLSSTDGQFSGTISNVRTGFAAWVLGTAGLAAGWAPYVVSQTHTSSLPVVSIRVDTKPDIQRRRVNKVTPTTSATTLTPWI